MQLPISENDIVVSLVDTSAQLIGGLAIRTVEAGTTGVVVAVHRQESDILGIATSIQSLALPFNLSLGL